MASLLRSMARARTTSGLASFRTPPQTVIPRGIPVQRRAAHDEASVSPEQRKAFEEELNAAIDEYGLRDETNVMRDSMEKDVFSLEREADYPRTVPRMRPGQVGFWAMDEEDEFAMTKDGDDHFNDDDITSMAHSQLQEHRDLREWARVAVWEMPLLSRLAKPFTLPSPSQPLRFRYTTYMGESHPAQSKVVLEFCPADLPNLSAPQRALLCKLLGARYNPHTGVARMSSEKFSTQAQNKRYLGDLVQRLVARASDAAADDFADVPMDTRHAKKKVKHVFPKEWEMNEQRRRMLEAKREEAKRLEAGRSFVVDGEEVVQEAVVRW